MLLLGQAELEAWVRSRDATLARASRREQLSRVGRINGDRIERLSVARLTIEDLSDGMRAYEMKVWQMSRFGTSTGCCVPRAALTQAVRWGWISRNPASLAELRFRKVRPRGVMSSADVRSVIVAGDSIGAEVGLMLRLAAVTGARRAELAALRWDDVVDGVLLIDFAIATDRRSGSTVLSDAVAVAIAAGHDVKTVADRLGHANAAMTLRVYAHAFAKSDRAVADSVGAILEEGK